MKYHWLIVPLACAACVHHAAPVSVDLASLDTTAVERTIAGGRWQTSATTAGNYRVVIRREGLKEPRRVAMLEWIQDRGSGAVVGQAIDLNQLAHVYALTDPVIVRRGANWILQLRAATAQRARYDSRVEFVLGEPATVTLIQSPPPVRDTLYSACALTCLHPNLFTLKPGQAVAITP